MNILIADDDAVCRLLLAAALQQAGHEVASASSGEEAWQQWERAPFPIVISDWMMPGLDGLELCRRIRAAGHARYSYVILLTSLAGKTRYLEAMDVGVDDFITKPFDEDELAAKLRAAARVLDLQREVKALQDLIPICAYCKKVRDDNDYWRQVESYITEHTAATFSHGICPECFEAQMAEARRLIGVENPA